MTYPSDEYDRPAKKVHGTLTTRHVELPRPRTQCFVGSVQVDPATVRPAESQDD